MSTFVVLKSANIGNRIKSYVSHMARYDKVKIEMPMDIHVFENFELATQEDINTYPHTASVWRLLVDQEEEKYCGEYKTIDLLYNNTPSYFINKYLPIFQNLKIRTDIQNKINSICNTWDKDNMVGVHIRSYLPPMEAGDRSVWVDFKGYENEIESIPSDQKIFFSTDNLDVMNYFKNKFKDRLITRERNVRGYYIGDVLAQDVEITQDAFIDMYLLSQCYKKLIVTFGSTFPECAWWFGGCRAQVVIPTIWDKVPQSFYDDVFIKR